MKCTICSKELNGLICGNKWCGEVHEECAICKKVISSSDAYEYRGFISCSPHFEELQAKVDYKRSEVIATVEHSTKSQAGGEWHNGGYKTMKTDMGGNPITKVNEPQILKDYENRIL